MQHGFMRRHAIRVAFVIVALAAGAFAIDDVAHRSTARKLREAILAELQPVALKNCTLKRFGSANDGGYLMCENLIEPLDAAYSYGVGRNDDWGCEMSRRYHVPVHRTIFQGDRLEFRKNRLTELACRGPARDIINRKGARCESDDDKCDADGISSHEAAGRRSRPLKGILTF